MRIHPIDLIDPERGRVRQEGDGIGLVVGSHGFGYAISRRFAMTWVNRAIADRCIRHARVVTLDENAIQPALFAGSRDSI